jgi:hypothetical protein
MPLRTSQCAAPTKTHHHYLEKTMKTSFTKLFRASISAALFCAVLWFALASHAAVRTHDDNRTPDLPSPLCDSVQVPSGNRVAFRVYARGVQIYKWNGASWTFVAPSADLFADANYQDKVGTHYGGPTWESNSGSKVIGSRVPGTGCAPDATAVPWLLLKAISTKGPGIFHGVTYIQRVNTVGGIAPTTPGTTIDEVAEVPYTTEYYFYRAEN